MRYTKFIEKELSNGWFETICLILVINTFMTTIRNLMTVAVRK